MLSVEGDPIAQAMDTWALFVETDPSKLGGTLVVSYEPDADALQVRGTLDHAAPAITVYDFV